MTPGASDRWWRQLPDGKPISALGFGCSSLWATPNFGEERAGALLAALADKGVNHFDTGPSYGKGLGERRLGAFLAGRDAGSFVISTKVGTNLVDGRLVRGFSRAPIERSFRDSLRRLGLARVDVLYLHGPALADLNDAVYGFFADMKAEGLIGFSGVNSFDNAVLTRVACSPIDAAMLQLNVADFRNWDVSGTLHAAGKLVFSGTALGRSAFDPWRFLRLDRGNLWYLLRMLRHNPRSFLGSRALRRELEALAPTPHDAAITFMVGNPRLLSSLFGTSSLAHAVANARSGHVVPAAPNWRRTAAALCHLNGLAWRSDQFASCEDFV